MIPYTARRTKFEIVFLTASHNWIDFQLCVFGNLDIFSIFVLFLELNLSFRNDISVLKGYTGERISSEI